MKTSTQIQQAVLEELSWEPYLKANEIGVTVKDGVVTLSGTVDAYFKKVIAEKAAARVAGVKAVAEDIEVRVGTQSKRTDTEIAAAVLQALKWHSAMENNSIKVKVESGWVSLYGKVQWDFQRRSARKMVETLSGVAGITNNITVEPEVEPVDVKRLIGEAFHRSATIDASQVKVQVEGGKVKLEGKVRSYAEKRDAEKAAWRAPGVIRVDNALEVEPGVYAM